MKHKPMVTQVKAPEADGHKPATPILRERISREEHVTLMARKAELEELKRKQLSLQRELTLVSADLYRKGDEFEQRIKEVVEKYKIVPGKRELKIETGEIIERGEK